MPKGVAPEDAVRVNIAPRGGGEAVEVPTSTRAEWPGMSFFAANVDLGGTGAPAVIQALDGAGAVVASARW